MYLCSGPILVEPSINNCRVKGAPEVKLFCNLNRVTGLNHSKLVLRLNVNDFIAESWKVKGFVVEDCKMNFLIFPMTTTCLQHYIAITYCYITLFDLLIVRCAEVFPCLYLNGWEKKTINNLTERGCFY